MAGSFLSTSSACETTVLAARTHRAALAANTTPVSRPAIASSGVHSPHFALRSRPPVHGVRLRWWSTAMACSAWDTAAKVGRSIGLECQQASISSR